MTTYREIFDLHLKYLDYILAKSLLAHQYVSDVSECGSTVEEEIRTLFRNMLPSRFRITHGYICHATDRDTEPKISPQIDLIIVDTLVPNSIFSMDNKGGMEIVPEESVVGIFEIKRTLNKTSLTKSLEHLKKILDATQIKKDKKEDYFIGGIKIDNANGIILNTGITSNPIIGIVCLDHKIDDFSEAKFDSLRGFEFIDLIFSTNGILVCTKDNISGGFKLFNVRTTKEEIHYNIMRSNSQDEKRTILSYGFGMISAYLNRCSGRLLNIDNYFFNKTILPNPAKPQ